MGKPHMSRDDDMLLFTCEGCGYGVIQLLDGRLSTPTHGLCAICVHVSEHAPIEELMEVRRRCEPGGWDSERKRRQAAND